MAPAAGLRLIRPLVRARPLRLRVQTGVRPWWAQRLALRDGRDIRTVFLVGVTGRQSGKAQPLDEPVLTPSGWRAIGSLNPGDQVIAGDGTPTEVVSVHPQGEQDIFRLEFDDGAWTRCTNDHLWTVRTRDDRRYMGAKEGRENAAWRVMSLREIRAAWGDEPKPSQRVHVPVPAPAPGHDRKLWVHPYLLGVLLGDGCLVGSAHLTCADMETIERIRPLIPEGCEIVQRSEIEWDIVANRRGGHGSNRLVNYLRAYGLMGVTGADKFVPEAYLTAPPAARLAVLQGLMDTDGTVGAKGGVCTFDNCSPRLATAVRHLTRSLGGKAPMHTRQPYVRYKGERRPGALSYRVNVRLPNHVPFLLSRKAARCFRATSRPDQRLLYKVEPAGRAPCVCIAVAHASQTYVTRDFVVTHNTWMGVSLVLERAIARPNGATLVLVPTYRMGLVQGQRLQRAAKDAIPGSTWSGSKVCLELPNGHQVWLRSADDPDATRGLTIDTTLWIDEAALVSEAAYTAALGCTVAHSPLVLITTTPRGRASWVYRLWSKPRPGLRRFMASTADSPFAGRVLDEMREAMGPERARQELEAEFTDDRGRPFPPEVVDALFSRNLGEPRGRKRVLGVDLAKLKDWTVIWLMNEFGEAWLLDRFQNLPWPEVQKRIAARSREHQAFVVLDEQHGGGYGGAMLDYLRADLGHDWVTPVRTGTPGTKAQIVEALIADATNGVVRAQAGPDVAQIKHELLWFDFTRTVTAGVERIKYEGPQSEGEHDDTVIGLALANFGRRNGPAVVTTVSDSYRPRGEGRGERGKNAGWRIGR